MHINDPYNHFGRGSFWLVAPLAHGFQRFELGFNITPLVKEYNILREVLLDEAVASAVDTFSAGQAREHESRVQERLSYVARDLKTPLSAIHTASLLLERLSEDSHKRVAPMLAVILRNCDHVNTMLMKLLEDKATSSAILHAELVRGDVPLHKAAVEVVADLRPLAERTGVKMQNAVPTNLSLNADPFMSRRLMAERLWSKAHRTEERQ
jgi:signal transduction histidine kinase